ncbi:hypothetical protein [Sporomusa acidovorans]|uniref:CheW-like domain-containing protein n=1 Tax=Sporomusa acidovorans (strain ATCC 49682 / DSM 3132 / Mol) TaxID=1123286 RepID=A0ABZ3J8G9_SPOA4|nr:hypothetical protein [Sporomusa acidovorans]OZC16673.1 hypothetical protein SPACI_41440 [Sporomusa acidovorans DSM 3132]SDE06597.1 hypothetical protein SAMN04488499_100779 [Sporomusa acidovorans]
MEQNELQLLIVSLGANRYGIDLDQIAHLQNADAALPAVSLAELLDTTSLASCRYPKILLIKHKLQTPILITEPDEIATCNIGSICSLPAMLTGSAEKKGVWGLLPQERDLIILIDFYKNQSFMHMHFTGSTGKQV